MRTGLPNSLKAQQHLLFEMLGSTADDFAVDARLAHLIAIEVTLCIDSI